MIITVSPAPLAGNVQLPANASALHRHLLCAALCNAHTLIEADCANLGTQALCDGLTRFGSRSAHDKQHYLIAPAKSHLQQGIRIDSHRTGGKLGMTYSVTLKGQPLATVQTSTKSGKGLITSSNCYRVTADEADLDLAFLVAFAIARTDQVFYS